MAEGVKGEPAHGVLVGDLADVLVGYREAVHYLAELLGCAGPHGVAVRVVRFPADVVDSDVMPELHPERIAYVAGLPVIPEYPKVLLPLALLVGHDTITL